MYYRSWNKPMLEQLEWRVYTVAWYPRERTSTTRESVDASGDHTSLYGASV